MWKQGPSRCDLFKDKIRSEKISFIARKQSWNQSRAAYDRDLEDFEIDEEIILDSEINLKFNEYSSEEIQRTSSTSMSWVYIIFSSFCLCGLSKLLKQF